MMNSTNFANSLKRSIRLGSRGGFFVARADGKKKYNPVAKFRKTTDGSMVKITKANLAAVPNAIRPARAGKAKTTPKPRGRPALSESVRATRAFAKILNRQVAPPRLKARKVAAKNVMVVSPGGTLYKSKRSMMTRARVAEKKRRARLNPFAALNNKLMR